MELFKNKKEINTFILVDKFKEPKILMDLLDNIKEYTNFLPVPTNVHAKHTDFKFLNHNKHFLKFLNKISYATSLIHDGKFVLKSSWANIYQKKEDYTQRHNHSSCTFSGILYLSDGPGPGTYFNDYNLTINEEFGKFVLFHSYLDHEVYKFDYKKDRITVAFNCDDFSSYQNVLAGQENIIDIKDIV